MRKIGIFSRCSICLLINAVVFCACMGSRWSIHEFRQVDDRPKIEPDFSDVVIPPNIAPLNFVISNQAEKYWVKIYGDSGKPIIIQSKNSAVQIPQQKWQSLISRSKGKSIRVEIFTYCSAKQWVRYLPINIRVAKEPIDRYLVYRFLRPNYTVQQEMTLRQRDMTTYSESLIMTTKTISACVNCHSFRNNDPSDMLFHIRWGASAGTIFAQKGEITKIDTRTPLNDSPGAYPSWHPSGKLTAFSVNKVYQFLHASGDSRDVIDLSSDIIIYKTDQNRVTTDAALFGADYMETFPAWSPDGRYLYFCRAPQLDEDFILERDFNKIKYDLMRVAYNLSDDTWGEPEILISAQTTKMSCSHPRISPDGRYLLFCMAEYGAFPIFHSSSDLYIMDLNNQEYSRLVYNSPQPEGYHSWSSNSRWITFTSKRDNGVYTRLYFSYIDHNGQVQKPFILPQKNPLLDQRLFYSYSVPELITKRVPFTARHFIKAANDPNRARKASLDPNLPLIDPSREQHQLTTTDYP